MIHGQTNVNFMLPCYRHQPVASNVIIVCWRDSYLLRTVTDNVPAQISAYIPLSMLVLVKLLVAIVAHVRGMMSIYGQYNVNYMLVIPYQPQQLSISNDVV